MHHVQIQRQTTSTPTSAGGPGTAQDLTDNCLRTVVNSQNSVAALNYSPEVTNSQTGSQFDISRVTNVGPSENHAGAQGVRNGMFDGAHSFVMYNPKVTSIVTAAGAGEMEQLLAYTIPGAKYNSSARDPPPRCHPDTRLEILQSLLDWAKQDNPSKRLYRICGPMGVGKSAIMQTLAESLAQSNLLGATLFFSSSHKRNNPNRVFPTIAYQLAVRIPSYRNYIRGQLDLDLTLLDSAKSSQFQKLIVDPFSEGTIKEGQHSLAILLDGLDECEDKRAQREIVLLISNFVQQHPTVPLAWVISSRSEDYLERLFSHPRIRTSYLQFHLSIDSTDATRDVECYLHSEFLRIRQIFPDIFPASESWPTQEQFVKIARIASGFFVFASAIITFLEDAESGNPVSRLEHILDALVEASPRGASNLNMTDQFGPFTPLNALYTTILRNVPISELPVARKLLGFFLYPPSPRTIHFAAACNLLQIKQHEAYGSLLQLHSILRVPPPHQAADSSLEFFHTSFGDYLRNPHISGEFSISPKDVATDCWLSSFRVLHHIISVSESDCDASIQEALTWPCINVPGFIDDIRSIWTGNLWKCSLINSEANPIHLNISDAMKLMEKINYGRLMRYLESVINVTRFTEWVLTELGHTGRLNFVTELSLQDIVMNCILDKERVLHTEYRVLPDSEHDKYDPIYTWYSSLHSDLGSGYRHISELLTLLQLRKDSHPNSAGHVWGTEDSKSQCFLLKHRITDELDDEGYFKEELFIVPYRIKR